MKRDYLSWIALWSHSSGARVSESGKEQIRDGNVGLNATVSVSTACNVVSLWTTGVNSNKKMEIEKMENEKKMKKKKNGAPARPQRSKRAQEQHQQEQQEANFAPTFARTPPKIPDTVSKLPVMCGASA